VPEDAIYNIDEFFKEKEYVFTGELGFGEGDKIRTARLSDSESSPFGKALDINGTGKMLVSVNTDLVRSTANFVKKGVMVNAIIYIQAAERGMPDMVITHRENPLLAELLVVDKKNAEAGEPTEKGREAIPSVVTFKTSNIQQASDLIRFNEVGKIYLLPVGVDAEFYLKQQIIASK